MGGAKKNKKPGTEKVLVGTRLIALYCNEGQKYCSTIQQYCTESKRESFLSFVSRCETEACVGGRSSQRGRGVQVLNEV